MSDDVRRPFVRFEVRQLEDRASSIEKGYYCTKDVDIIVLIPHASQGKTSLEYVYEDWLKRNREISHDLSAPGGLSDTPLVMTSRFPATWLKEIEAGYAAWKEGREIPLEGTALLNWPPISPSMRNVCIGMHIRTVEELAGASDEALGNMGMGAVQLRQRARDWLQAQGGQSGKLSAELQAARQETLDQAVRIKSLEEQLAKLLAKEAA